MPTSTRKEELENLLNELREESRNALDNDDGILMMGSPRVGGDMVTLDMNGKSGLGAPI